MQTVQDFLDSNQVKYTITSYSPTYSIEELEEEQAMLGMEFVETALLEIDGGQVVMGIFPQSMMIDLFALKDKLRVKNIRVLSPEEVKKIFPDHPSDFIAPFGKFYGLTVLLAEELDNNTQIKFLDESPRKLLSMSSSELVKLSDIREDIRINTKSKYHVLVNEVSPEIERHKLEDYDSCFLGISLENPSFSTVKLIAMTDWIAKRFRSCKVLIGDSLHRLTLQIDHRDLTERQALTQALLLGKAYINTELAVFDRHLNTCTFEFIYCSEIQQLNNYQEYYEIFQDLCQNNVKLAEAVNTFSLEFVRRHLEINRSCISDHDFLEICRQYLLEELAIFACLFESHLCPILYPGSLSIFEEIAKGEHADVPACLQNMIYVSLRFKRR